MTTPTRRDINAYRMAANKIRRDVANAQHMLEQAAVFDRVADELEDYLANGDDLDDPTFVNPPDAEPLFGDDTR